MRFLLIFLYFVPVIVSLDILLYSTIFGKSHLSFVETLIKVLNDNGHNVDLILGHMNTADAVEGTYGARKAEIVRFPGESPWKSTAGHLQNPFEEHSHLEEMSPFNEFMTRFINSTDSLCQLVFDSSEVHELLTTNKYDIALMGGFEFCPFALAYHYKISPVASYVPTPAVPLQIYAAGIPELPLYENFVFRTRLQSDRNYLITRLWETIRMFKEHYNYWLKYTSMNRIMRERFGESFPDVRDIYRNVSIYFVNSNSILDEPRPMSSSFRYIGGVGLPKAKSVNNEFDKILNVSKKGTVLFSFGTQVPPDRISPQLRNVFIDSFKSFPDFTFIWRYDGKTALNASNVYNVKWLPQTHLLYDERVVGFISHMGQNSFIETSFAGVPVVSIPLFIDQVHNARRADALGMGAIVPKTEITVEKLTSALAKILNDPSYRIRAKEISSMLKTNPDNSIRNFIEGIEFAAQHKTLHSHYRLKGSDRSTFVQLGWDVVTLFIISSIAISVMSARFLKPLLFVRAKKIKKE